jgi:glycosyltransferase involved in cell wall biosynthesis
MRIAVWHNLPSGGGKRALYDQVRGLVARGHEIEAWCPPTADQSYLPLSDLVREHIVPLSLEAHLKRPPSFSQKLHPVHWNARVRLRAMRQHCRQCARLINAGRFDLFFGAGCMFFHTPRIGRFIQIPSIVYLQEPHRPFYEPSPDLPWVAMPWTTRDLFDRLFWRKALLRKLRLPGMRIQAREERLDAMAYDRILVNSLYSRESVLRALGVNSRVCYLGIDTERFVNQHKARERFAICVGACIPNKNIELLISSLAKVPKANRPGLILVANIFSEPYLEGIQALAAQGGVKVELKLRISDPELIDLLNRARMMLYAPRLEPFGLAPLEANACGLPVIAVAEGGVRETILDGINGLLVEHDSESMARAIERLSVDDLLHRRLSEEAHRTANTKWSLPSSIDRLEESLMAQIRSGTSAANNSSVARALA